MTKAIDPEKLVFWLTIPQITSAITIVVAGVVAFMNISNRVSFIEKTYVSEASLRTILDEKFSSWETSLEESIRKEIQYAISQENTK